MRLSIVVPAWNEGRRIAGTLKRLRATARPDSVEIIVVDGGSKDGTLKFARESADKVIPLGGANRGAQLHKGAREASGELLLFLHADAQLPGDWQAALEAFWNSERSAGSAATVFSVHYGAGFRLAFAALAANLRVSLRNSAYGESGLCVPKSIYEGAGGFPDFPMMEDLALCARLRPLGRIVRLKECIRPAAHDLRRTGPLRSILRRFAYRMRFAFGEDPESLFRRRYGDGPHSPPAPEPWDGEALLKKAVRDRDFP
ncbi:MAG: hypothetical protein AUJ52_10780 [Elusimicrobia bacterium CG1_02_63_36]|nr:MAG: hypothetical protein AUJ52_10780 [Elusimicrobia bacterium CG1_02_63_36]PIP82547.1 MAG: hypothetical protein COR54_14165 [Elusimicrobia bacterium CG22_combo_CG10-13_8_21_14_all_63_91]PJA12926.1 MAG: hypothetical protein COX66_16095 [Elusimicrobia bacterium CG_4_10_14_0_2_um_filter_63_34]PJB25825.1 MAG: hypothetical protein CO113_06655 [Elusimicrobia bacterium CG_4_9_14_3_um_filter_62_55]